MTSTVEIFLSFLITSLPTIAIATVGLVLVHTRLRRSHPRAYRCGTAGLALLLVNGLGAVVAQTYIQAARAAQTQHPLALASKITMVGVAGFVVTTAALVLILVAVLADRGTAGSTGGAS